jgi:heparosan-N-sulfate-glucuronate 5-epimerase
MVYISIALFAVLFIVLIQLYKVYRYSYLPRFDNLYGMEMYNGENNDIHDKELGLYYGDFNKGIRAKYFDNHGVVQVEINGKRFYNPCQVAEYAIICHDSYILKNQDKYKSSFKIHLDWLCENAVKVSGTGVCWYYHYDSDNEMAPWGSCISQGIAISALLRGYQQFEEDKYLEKALQSFELMNRPVKERGFRYSDSEYKLWYEEDNFQRHILNGHIYALLGIYDLYRITGEQQYLTIFDDGISTIIDRIKDFDLGFNTKYDKVNPYPANNSYHFTHITLFKILYKITNDSFFKLKYNKFELYTKKGQYKAATYFYILRLVIKDKFKGIID